MNSLHLQVGSSARGQHVQVEVSLLLLRAGGAAMHTPCILLLRAGGDAIHALAMHATSQHAGPCFRPRQACCFSGLAPCRHAIAPATRMHRAAMHAIPYPYPSSPLALLLLLRAGGHWAPTFAEQSPRHAFADSPAPPCPHLRHILAPPCSRPHSPTIWNPAYPSSSQTDNSEPQKLISANIDVMKVRKAAAGAGGMRRGRNRSRGEDNLLQTRAMRSMSLPPPLFLPPQRPA